MKAQIKGLTLHRPWGYAIARLDKRVENRSWACWLKPGDYIAIHNGQKWDKNASRFIREMGDSETKSDAEINTPGMIIAVARFDGNIKDEDPGRSPWFFGPYGWLLSEVVEIEPVLAKGQQGLWNLPEAVLQSVRLNHKKARETDAYGQKLLGYSTGLRDLIPVAKK